MYQNWFLNRLLTFCGVYTSSKQDLQHFIENTVRRKRSHTPTLTLTKTKCGLKVSLGDLSFFGINLRILQTELKMVIVIADKVSFYEETVRDTSKNDTSSTATLRRKFLSNYQFDEKQLLRMHFSQIRHFVEIFRSSQYLVDTMFCSVLFCNYILPMKSHPP